MLTALAVVGFRGGLFAAEPTMDPRSEGTLEMIERLGRIDRNMNARINSYESRRRVEMFQMDLATETDPVQRLKLLGHYALELLNAGDSLAAVNAFRALEEFEKQFSNVPERDLKLTQLLKAVSWLRVGEQQNCITNHTSDSCLLPISANGVHQLTRGSTEAIKVLSQLLDTHPEMLDAKWLLNIAYMTLGKYPAGVPEEWRIASDIFDSDHDITRFTDVAADLAIDGNALSGGVVADDFNNDGFLDLMVSGYALNEQIEFYLNDRTGGFVNRTREAGLAGLTGGLNLVQADYDNDGDTDVFALRGAWMARAGRIPNSLLRNNGDGTFSDVTKSAGVMTARPTQTARWFDYNGDGWLDLFVGNETTPGNQNRCELYTNNGDGTFRENSFECGIRVFEFVKGVASGDYNNDGRPDLFLSIIGADNILLRNDGPDGDKWKFTDVSNEAGVARPLNSFPCWFFDYDNDGWEDLLVCNFDLNEMHDSVADILGIRQGADNTRLYRNRGDGTFEDVSEQKRMDPNLLAMGANFGDLDNDGWLDLYVGTGNPDLRALVPNKMYRNHGGKVFQDVTTSGGFGHLQKGHAIAFADFDLDGDQDVYANMGGAYTGDVYRNALFENPGHGNHWISLKLEGKTSNRSAIGARIKVVTAHEGQSREIHRTVSSGASFGANPLRQEIGLGPAQTVERVEVFWPTTGEIQIFEKLESDSIYYIVEGSGEAKELPLKSVPFKRPAAGHGHQHHN